jgi:hypothetical protein
MEAPLQPQATGRRGEHEKPVPVCHRDASVEDAVDTSAYLVVAALQTMKISQRVAVVQVRKMQLTPYSHGRRSSGLSWMQVKEMLRSSTRY